MKKFVSALLAAALAASLVACGSTPASAGTDGSSAAGPTAASYTVGICQLVQHDALDAATQGFKDALTEKLGDAVKAGEPICTLYADDDTLFAAAEEMYVGGLTIGAEKPEVPPLIYARVTSEGVERF